MKKFLCICLTLITFVCCFAFVGCEEKDDINYTAEKPVYQYDSEVYDYGDGRDENVQLTLKGCTPIKSFKFYKDFSKYYSDNLKGNKEYLLYRSNEIQPLTPYDEGYFGFYRENETEDLILKEAFDYYDKELGTKPTGGEDGVKSVSVYFSIFIKSFEKIETSEITLEFGKTVSKNGLPDKYINIYSGEECFATCYFHNKVYIPQEWYENYLKTNLIYGDDL